MLKYLSFNCLCCLIYLGIMKTLLRYICYGIYLDVVFADHDVNMYDLEITILVCLSFINKIFKVII